MQTRLQKRWQEGLAISADTSLIQQVHKALEDCGNYAFVQFRVPGVPDKHWRICLCPDYALLSCLSLRSTKHFFIAKEEFSIRTKKDLLVLSGIKIKIQLDQMHLVGYTTKEDMDRFNDWKNQSGEPPYGEVGSANLANYHSEKTREKTRSDLKN